MGRAGRDGSEATCWLVLDDSDYERLRSLACSNAVELPSVKSFLTKVRAAEEEEEEEATLLM